MFLLQSSGFDWKEFLVGGEEWTFLFEVILRTVIMFGVILTGLSVLGKRGVRQLSIFELVVIIGLGSAAGDPMFYKDVGLLPAVIVFTLIIGFYVMVTHLVGTNKKLEKLIEGESMCLVRDGEFAISNFSKENLGQDEFFAEMRAKGVSQLGQVSEAIIEVNGSLSVFFYEREDTKPGLSIMPGSLKEKSHTIIEAGNHSCVFCAYTKFMQPSSINICPRCGKKEWVKSSDRKRVT